MRQEWQPCPSRFSKGRLSSRRPEVDPDALRQRAELRQNLFLREVRYRRRPVCVVKDRPPADHHVVKLPEIEPQVPTQLAQFVRDLRHRLPADDVGAFDDRLPGVAHHIRFRVPQELPQAQAVETVTA